uniref:Uncharacterized protein n=1 Tax=viral metagenome TaxID=1070528 RepID=A0A6C0CPV7_9ZZZZ
MAITSFNVPAPIAPASPSPIPSEFYEEEHQWPEMSDVEKDIIIEWLSLGENPDYENQECHGVNLYELIKILQEKYTLMARSMPNASVGDRLRAFNWTPYPSPVNGELNLYHNPLCTLLVFRIMIEIGRNEPTLQDNENNLRRKMVNQFNVIKAHYFNITD